MPQRQSKGAKVSRRVALTVSMQKLCKQILYVAESYRLCRHTTLWALTWQLLTLAAYGPGRPKFRCASWTDSLLDFPKSVVNQITLLQCLQDRLLLCNALSVATRSAERPSHATSLYQRVL